jgi:hypothetical protein
MIKLIIIIVILILVVSYFGINIQQVATSPASQGNFSYVWNGAVHLWDTYLAGPLTYAWNTVGTALWKAFMQGVQNVKVNQSIPNSTVYPQATGQ